LAFSSSTTFQTGSDITPAFKASQKTIDLLESISPVDVAMAQPYIKIMPVDLVTGEPVKGASAINAFFTKPPAFGRSIKQVDSSDSPTVMGERPPVSLERMTIKTKQNYGTIMEEHLEFDIVVHRPDAVFDSDDSGWATLITPGRPHQLIYGWAGSSKNGLVNGNGFQDPQTNTFILSRRSLIFTTSFYTFSLKPNGEIKMKIKAYNNGQYMLRNVSVGDIPGIDELADELRDRSEDLATPAKLEKDQATMKAIRAQLQGKLDLKLLGDKVIRKNGTNFITFKTVADIFVAPTIVKIGKLWGYNKFVLQFANFNSKSGGTKSNKKSKVGASQEYGSKTIGSFLFDIASIKKNLKLLLKKDAKMSMSNFLSIFINLLNNSRWEYKGKGEKTNDFQKPNIKIKVLEVEADKQKALSIVIFDQWAELKKLRSSGKIEPKDQTREKIRSVVANADVPYITLGKGFSYIRDGSFEAQMDQQISRIKMIKAAQHFKDRGSFVSSSSEALERTGPNPYHEIFASSVQGKITMLGNFAFDTFGLIWLDFRASIWSGPFTVLERTDVLTNADFTTQITVQHEGDDPLNTRKRLTKEFRDNLRKKNQAKVKLVEDARAKRRRRRSKRNKDKGPDTRLNRKLNEGGLG
jgi:hypothetical protein